MKRGEWSPWHWVSNVVGRRWRGSLLGTVLLAIAQGLEAGKPVVVSQAVGNLVDLGQATLLRAETLGGIAGGVRQLESPRDRGISGQSLQH